MRYCRLVTLFVKLEMIRHIKTRRIMQENDLHFGQQPMLEFVLSHEGCTQKEAADELNITPASIAASFKRLEKAGYLRRESDARDTRRNRVYVTKIGRDKAAACRRALDALDEQAFSGFTQSELDTLAGMLERICAQSAGEEFRALSVFSLMNTDKGFLSDHKEGHA